MTQNYEVVSENGVEINGTIYEKGHVFSFGENLSDEVQAFIESGDIIVQENKAGEEASSEASSDQNSDSSQTDGEATGIANGTKDTEAGAEGASEVGEKQSE